MLSLHKTANNHLSLNFNKLPDKYWQSVVAMLEREGFSRAGRTVIGAGEMIHQDFVTPEFTLAAGWDNWSGHYLLSANTAGDQFLQALSEKLSTSRV